MSVHSFDTFLHTLNSDQPQSSSTADTARQVSSEPQDNPPQPQNWIIEQQRELKWTPSPPSSSSLPSLSSSSVPSPTSSTSSSSSGLPSIASSTSPEVKLSDPSRFIPAQQGSVSSSDFYKRKYHQLQTKEKNQNHLKADRLTGAQQICREYQVKL